jgi:hypothetical protein
MPSASQKGSYYARRTREWLEKELGFDVVPLERTSRIVKQKASPLPGEDPNRVIFIKRDIWGADVMAKDDERLIFIQVKSNEGHIARGMKELSKGRWPPSVERWVVYWPPRRRLKEGPEIHVVGPRVPAEESDHES